MILLLRKILGGEKNAVPFGVLAKEKLPSQASAAATAQSLSGA